MTTKKVDKDEKVDEGEAEDNESSTADAKSDKPDEEAGSGDGGRGGLEDSIREIVAEVVEPLLGKRSTSRRTTVADDEDEIFRKVKAAQDKLKAEETKEGRVSKLEEALQKVTERPPSRAGVGGRLQRWLWGEE